jgi:hypothetical protein
MQDKRFITNYMQRRQLDQIVRQVNSIESAQDYRFFLQKNGDTILNRERAILQKINTCDVAGLCVPLSGPSF